MIKFKKGKMYKAVDCTSKPKTYGIYFLIVERDDENIYHKKSESSKVFIADGVEHAVIDAGGSISVVRADLEHSIGGIRK